MEKTEFRLAKLNINSEKNINCPICLECIDSQIISELSSCLHIICEPCFKNMLNFSNKCPLCLKVFTSCFYKENSLILSEYTLTEKDLQNIMGFRNSIYHEETFECLSRDEIQSELQNYKKMMEKIEIELFVHRTSDGSEKEGILYEEILDSIFYCREAIKIEKFDGKLIAENLEFIVNGIKDLQSRKFKNSRLTLEDDYFNHEYDELHNETFKDDFSLDFKNYDIEYIDKKKSNKKKKKK